MGQEILSPPDLSPVGGVSGDEQQNSFSNISNQSSSKSHQHNDSATNISNQSPSKSYQHNDSATNISNQSPSLSHQHKPSPTQSTPKKKDRFGDQIEKSLDKNVRRMKK